MSEPIGIWLMPLYAIASWYGIFTQGNTGKYFFPVALVGWLWAGVNIYRTNRLDLGIVTFFFVLVASLCERKYGFTRGVKLALSVSSIMVALNYSLVVVFWKQIQKDLVKSKSQLWMNIFWGYCACMVAFWVCAAAKNHTRGENEYSVV
eukprot:CAMPEP_0196136646 /NCGR_PEP_ID=MMETSP0910-20130528/4888_1 /TAXON_ID=49265 /ORGANISM="Thalassiosira rotula, Strain GSO102" /LENGTH=148 /DNA_ID=CAMNT_0041396967 /DNA_START=114 /DNA_END=560 /DNA_ORIENTATION=-